MSALREEFERQQLSNGYQLVNGVAMHDENGAQFQIPHDVLKKHVVVGYFVELRIDSTRFSAHPDAPNNCTCPHCNEKATKPILSHDHPASLLPLPEQNVPSRGWGEDFWAQVMERDGDYCAGAIDNPLYESRLHGLDEGDRLLFHSDHILAVHSVHRRETVLKLDPNELKQLAQWLASQD